MANVKLKKKKDDGGYEQLYPHTLAKNVMTGTGNVDTDIIMLRQRIINLEYNKTGLGAQAIIFKDNSIDFEVQNGGGTTGGSYTPAPKVQIFGDGKVKISSLPVFADDAAAGSGGLTTGYLYQTSSGDLKIKL